MGVKCRVMTTEPQYTRSDYEEATRRVRERLNEWRRGKGVPEVDYGSADPLTVDVVDQGRERLERFLSEDHRSTATEEELLEDVEELERAVAEDGPCPHQRPTWRMCPHCLGVNG